MSANTAYKMYLQYNKQWYQIVRYILSNFLPFRTVAFLITVQIAFLIFIFLILYLCIFQCF